MSMTLAAPPQPLAELQQKKWDLGAVRQTYCCRTKKGRWTDASSIDWVGSIDSVLACAVLLCATTRWRVAEQRQWFIDGRVCGIEQFRRCRWGQHDGVLFEQPVPEQFQQVHGRQPIDRSKHGRRIGGDGRSIRASDRCDGAWGLKRFNAWRIWRTRGHRRRVWTWFRGLRHGRIRPQQFWPQQLWPQWTKLG